MTQEEKKANSEKLIEANAKNMGRSFPIFSATTASLIILKAMNIISIPWFWVFAPLWIPLALMGGTLLIVVILIAIAAALD
jgi:membrane protein YdbS with pleckstrin-like domain